MSAHAVPIGAPHSVIQPSLTERTACRLALFFVGLSRSFLKSSMCVSSSTRSRSTFTNDDSERAERSWYRPRRPTSDSLSSILNTRSQSLAWLKEKRCFILKLQNSSLCLARAKNRRNSRSPPSTRSTTVYRKESPTLSLSLFFANSIVGSAIPLPFGRECMTPFRNMRR